jgi:glycosyltransferase 2 family protein
VTRALSVLLVAGGAIGLVAVAYLAGAESLVSALARITGWQFALVCAVYGAGVIADTLGWRYTLGRAQSPGFPRLLAAKCAGEAVNVLTALGSVGGEATKAWLLRRDVPYDASVPSLVAAKTSLVTAQALLIVVGILVAWITGIGGPALLLAMTVLLFVEVIGVGGFLVVQLTGVVGRAGRVLAWLGVDPTGHAQRVDDALRRFYRRQWRSFLLSVGFHFVGWLIGAVEACLILGALGLPASLVEATVIEALGSGVRFATFFVPASLGALEGANAGAFAAFGWAASAGLAFSVVRRARQAVWIGVGLAILLGTNARGVIAGPRFRPAPSGGP